MSYAAEIESSVVRPKLNLQPRSSVADLAGMGAKYANKPSPFGAARPREQVLAERQGKKEEDVFKEQAQKEWKGSIILTEPQREEKRAAEAELASARRELEAEVDPVKLKTLKEDVIIKQRKLEGLLNSFEASLF
ncbi:eukaryotic translation initiation factor 4B2-like [Selaginella moellendorffii]|uniref:eukaryotic translation initiation factor 4B2-like n=1 Tax=Selaginella moellendorffii TaxID=88036 RepID=UPI000D1C3521|nr:eukaryotic translation initiation factor 4B2-like [Selaginella moellendorffii]|eukprot:XP_024529600.1 eukaryotic translation initiation factor 4B2-like [Selaginella moellendorffii]